jgi:8-oxo-dGTP pyrophosphatase MutT (NUDIX family)
MTLPFADSALIDWLTDRLTRPLPGWRAQARFQPELSFGRHFSPPPSDARPAAVLMLLYPSAGRWTLPLTLRRDDMIDHAGQISFPGGTIDAGENSGCAALRELEEELGVASTELQMCGQLSPIYLFNSNFFVTPWLAAITSQPVWNPNPAEVAELIEAPLDDLAVSENRHHWTRTLNGVTAEVPGIRLTPHSIWGATCMMLGELLALVEEFRSQQL